MVALGHEPSCPGARESTNARIRMQLLTSNVFALPIDCEREEVQILLHMAGFECLHHLMVAPPLNLNS